MRRIVLSCLIIMLPLVTGWPLGALAQDTTPPELTSIQASVSLTRNGDPLTVSVDATANEPSRFEVTCSYASSYPRYGDSDLELEFWNWKTAAVGDHVETSQPPTLSVSDLEVLVGPRVYHADTLTVTVVAIDGAGNRSTPSVIHQAAIEMPFSEPPVPNGDHYGVATHWSGSRTPSVPYLASIEEWARPDLILCTSAFLFEGPQTDYGWDHWIPRLRNVPGGNNAAVVGFSGLSAVETEAYPVLQRLYDFLWSVHDEVDDNVLVHVTDGSLPSSVDGVPGRILTNIFHPMARDTLAWFLTQEWNHSENREPNVGLMFDVYEIWTEYAVNGEYAPGIIDRDRDGIPMIDDPDELEGTRIGRYEFLRSLRRHIAASSEDPNVGRHFLIGANTVTGRSDALMLAELDFALLEDIQCAPSAGHEFNVYDGNGCYDDHLMRIPFHGAAAEHFTRSYCPGIFYENHLITSGAIPFPSDLSQAWEDIAPYMRSDAGGPFLAPESQGSVSRLPVHPGYLEVFSLLFDHFYPIWHLQEEGETWRRQYWHPDREGLADLHGLGAATTPLIRDRLDDDILYWRREYQSGTVEVVIADTTIFDCEMGDLFDFRVTMNGEVVRQSASWGPPELETFFVADWDSAGADHGIRVDLTALASEPVQWERSYRLGDAGPWSEPEPTEGREASLAGHWETGLTPQSGSLWVRVRGRDQTGQTTDWAKRQVMLQRFGGFGVVIEDTLVHGTDYGLPSASGQYDVEGRGQAVPDFAPPHVLEIRGTVEPGFYPVEVRWRNSLGGEGQAEGTLNWRAPVVPLHRGTNVITITCIDASGTARVGTVVKEWQFPGKPGRER